VSDATHPDPEGVAEGSASPEAEGAPVGHEADGVSAEMLEPDPHPGEISVEALIETIESVTAERDTHLADLQRLTADFANFRKQTDKRQTEIREQAAGRLVEDLLPVLDAMDAAAQQGVEGVEQVHEQLLGVLRRNGLEDLGRVGDPFDPHQHEAAMTEPGDGDEEGPTVSQVLRTGYGWNGRVLRAAMVAVKG